MDDRSSAASSTIADPRNRRKLGKLKVPSGSEDPLSHRRNDGQSSRRPKPSHRSYQMSKAKHEASHPADEKRKTKALSSSKLPVDERKDDIAAALLPASANSPAGTLAASSTASTNESGEFAQVIAEPMSTPALKARDWNSVDGAETQDTASILPSTSGTPAAANAPAAIEVPAARGMFTNAKIEMGIARLELEDLLAKEAAGWDDHVLSAKLEAVRQAVAEKVTREAQLKLDVAELNAKLEAAREAAVQKVGIEAKRKLEAIESRTESLKAAAVQKVESEKATGEFCDQFNLHMRCGMPNDGFDERGRGYCTRCIGKNVGKGKKKMQKRSFDDMSDGRN